MSLAQIWRRIELLLQLVEYLADFVVEQGADQAAVLVDGGEQLAVRKRYRACDPVRGPLEHGPRFAGL